MKNLYEKPELEITGFEAHDFVAISEAVVNNEGIEDGGEASA